MSAKHLWPFGTLSSRPSVSASQLSPVLGSSLIVICYLSLLVAIHQAIGERQRKGMEVGALGRRLLLIKHWPQRKPMPGTVWTKSIHLGIRHYSKKGLLKIKPSLYVSVSCLQHYYQENTWLSARGLIVSLQHFQLTFPTQWGNSSIVISRLSNDQIQPTEV